MNLTRTPLLLGFALLFLILDRVQCITPAIRFTCQTLVPAGTWSPASVPPQVTATINLTILNPGITLATIPNAAGLTVGAPISGPNVPPGTTIAAIVNV